ncbi:MAG: glycosyltransferase family 39 protein [Roseiflexaceae bacterium]|nr:glycosyltransferase family 39 protein [Roseiflexaceae bacterium]
MRVRTFTLALAASVALALALRIGLWWMQARSGAVQAGDPEEYYRAALELMRGSYYDTGKWIRPPLYPLFLAALFLSGGIDTAQAMLLQAILGAAGVLLFAWYGWQRFGRRSVALASAALAALYIPLASFGSAMFAEGLFVLIMLASLAALDRVLVTPRYATRWALLAGALLALAALARAVGLFFIPLAAAIVLLGGTTPQSWRKRATLAAALIIAAALVIAPWTIRNALVHQRLILIDTNGPISMWYGTLRDDAEQQAGEAAIFALPNQADRQALATRLTLANIAQDPLGFVLRARYKIASLLLLHTRNYTTGSIIGLDQRGQQVVFVEAEHPLWLALLADLEYIPLMLAAIAGLYFAPQWRRTLPLLAFVALSVALSAVTIGHPRLRLPIVCVLMPYAAFLLVSVGELRPRPRWRVGLALASGLLFVSLVVSTRYLPWAWAELAAVRGRSAQGRGAYTDAQQQFEQAAAANPSALRSLDLADLAVARGDQVQAITHYRAARDQEPRNVYGRARLAELLSAQGQQPQAQAELDQIAGYGRDTNDLYQFLWRNPLNPPPPQLTPGEVAALGHVTGFAPATADLPAGRWTLGEAALRLAPGCGPIELQLRGPPGRVVTLQIINGLRMEVVLEGGVQRVSIAQPDANCGQQPVVLTVSSATSLLDRTAAPWMTGVAIIEARATP